MAKTRAKGRSQDPWAGCDSRTKWVLARVADCAKNRTVVRIYYKPKVTASPGGVDFGTTTHVYRSVAPYSIRWRRVHVNGYDKPPKRVPVFFGYDLTAKTIKMFVADRIRTVQNTGREFDPSWPIELESKVTRVDSPPEDVGLAFFITHDGEIIVDDSEERGDINHWELIARHLGLSDKPRKDVEQRIQRFLDRRVALQGFINGPIAKVWGRPTQEQVDLLVSEYDVEEVEWFGSPLEEQFSSDGHTLRIRARQWEFLSAFLAEVLPQDDLPDMEGSSPAPDDEPTVVLRFSGGKSWAIARKFFEDIGVELLEAGGMRQGRLVGHAGDRKAPRSPLGYPKGTRGQPGGQERQGKATHTDVERLVDRLLSQERYGGAEGERSIWYHGTQSKNLKSILANGLIPDPKIRAWADDPDASSSVVSRASYSGIYVTKNLMTALSAAGRGQCYRDRTLVIMSLQPRTFVADEDVFAGHLNKVAGERLVENDWLISQYFFSLEKLGRSDSLVKATIDFNVKNNMEWLATMVPKQTMQVLNDKLRTVLADAWVAAVRRRAAYVKPDYSWKASYSHVTNTEDEPPPPPDKAEAEAEYRKVIDQLTQMLKSVARPSVHQSFMQTARILEPIGFSGSNRIEAIVSLVPNKENKRRDDIQIVWPVGGTIEDLPQDFLNQWKTRVGKIRIAEGKESFGKTTEKWAGNPRAKRPVEIFNVYIDTAYFPKSLRPVDAFAQAFEKWTVRAASRQEAADKVWAEHGERLLKLMLPSTSRLPRKVSLHVNAPWAGVGGYAFRLTPLLVYTGTADETRIILRYQGTIPTENVDEEIPAWTEKEALKKVLAKHPEIQDPERYLRIPKKFVTYLGGGTEKGGVVQKDLGLERIIDLLLNEQDVISTNPTGVQKRGAMEIDADLDLRQMDRLNNIPGITVTSTCAGHEEGTRSKQKAGDSRFAGFNFEVFRFRTPEKAWEAFKGMESEDTVVGVSAWGLRHAGVVWSSDEGGWRTGGNPKATWFFPEEVKKEPLDRIVVSVHTRIPATSDNLAERRKWWDKVIDKVYKIQGPTQNVVANLTSQTWRFHTDDEIDRAVEMMTAANVGSIEVPLGYPMQRIHRQLRGKAGRKRRRRRD